MFGNILPYSRDNTFIYIANNNTLTTGVTTSQSTGGYTWLKPTGINWVYIYAVGGGGGGGGGQSTASGSAAGGGGGGGSGAFTCMFGPSFLLPDVLYLFPGGGGIGGAPGGGALAGAAGTPTAIAIAGRNTSAYDTLIIARGGLGGSPASGGNGGAGGAGGVAAHSKSAAVESTLGSAFIYQSISGQAGTAGVQTGTATSISPLSYGPATGGTGGGGKSTANVLGNGGLIGSTLPYFYNYSGGTSTNKRFAEGSTLMYPLISSGGAGGYGATTSTYHGGDGGAGCGGGGGGGAQTGGRGGNGGPGIIAIICG